MPVINALELFKEAHGEGMIGDESFPLPSFLTKEAASKFLVVIGSNATGKSLITDTLLVAGKGWHGIKGYNISMAKRTGGDSMERMYVYQDERDHSTGVTTLHAIAGAWHNIKAYATDKDSPTPMLLVLDEPTIGLSLGYEKAMGKYLVQQYNALKDKENFVGLVVVTHSKDMMRQIQKEGVEPTVISTGEAFTLDDWYKDDEEKSIEELMSLRDKGRNGHNAVNKYIHANK